MKSTLIIILLLPFILFTAHAATDESDQLWEARRATYFTHHKIPYLEQVRFYTYLYAAQEEAASCSESVQRAILPLLTKRFFPGFQIDFADAPDPEAECSANELLCKYFVRMKQEETNPFNFPTSRWFRKIPPTVAMVAKWIPWTSPLPIPPPPLAATDAKGWAHQIEQLRKIRLNLTERELEIVRTWAGHHGPGANWRVMANLYMEEHNTPESKRAQVRTILMKALYDGIIAELHAKYTYCIPRPYMMYPDFKPLIKKLRTPSYPSGHGIQGAAFAGVMTYFFPNDFKYWHRLDVEGANTRLWAGVHFPEDIEQGRLLGAKIAAQTLNELEVNGNESSADAPPPPQWGSLQIHSQEIFQ